MYGRSDAAPAHGRRMRICATTTLSTRASARQAHLWLFASLWRTRRALRNECPPNTADKLRGARSCATPRDDSSTTEMRADYHASLQLQRRLVSFIRLFGGT